MSRTGVGEFSEHTISFPDFIDKTHKFLAARPVLLESNSPKVIFELLSMEVDELMAAVAENHQFIDQIGEVGDVIHFYNDGMKLMGYTPQDIVPRNGKPLETVADFRERTEHLAPDELKEKEILELCEILKQSAGALVVLLAREEATLNTILFDSTKSDAMQGAITLEENQFLELTKAKQVAEHKKLLNDILTILFLVSGKLHFDLVYAGTLKNQRNELKYPKEYFQDIASTSYEEARDLSRKNWKETGGDDVFFRVFLSQYPLQLLQILAE